MANHYLELSTMLKVQTPEEKAWLKAELKILEEKSELTLEPMGFDYEFEKDGLWIHSENATPELVAEFVQRFLAKFHPDKMFAFSWAYYCSKPRLDEFGGGAAIVRADGYETIDATGEAQKLLSEWGEEL